MKIEIGKSYTMDNPADEFLVVTVIRQLSAEEAGMDEELSFEVRDGSDGELLIARESELIDEAFM